jgi:hypothetical protein
MLPTAISPALVEQAEQLLAAGVDVPVVAARLNVTPYVVGVIANEPERRPGPPPPPRSVTRRVPGACRSIDAGTARMICRMLAAKRLNYVEIAREAAVSETTVSAVARGVRHLGMGIRPRLDDDEEYVPEGTRCPRCGSLVVVIPCRACLTREFSSSPSGCELRTS